MTTVSYYGVNQTIHSRRSQPVAPPIEEYEAWLDQQIEKTNSNRKLLQVTPERLRRAVMLRKSGETHQIIREACHLDMSRWLKKLPKELAA